MRTICFQKASFSFVKKISNCNHVPLINIICDTMGKNKALEPQLFNGFFRTTFAAGFRKSFEVSLEGNVYVPYLEKAVKIPSKITILSAAT